MPSIRQRIADLLLGDERQKLAESARTLYRAYLDGPWLNTPENLLAQLKEVDSSYLFDLVNQLTYEQIGTLGSGSYSGDTEAERIRNIKESRYSYKYDVVTGQVISVWTDFGFGQNVSLSSKDMEIQTWLTEFWEADRNAALLADDEIQEMSNDTLVDGERFIVHFISKLDGRDTLNEIDTEEIVEIVKDPNNKYQKLFYKRVWNTKDMTGKTLYYPDYLARLSGALDDLPENLLPKDAIRADLENDATDVMIQHIPHNKKGGDRGWPIMTAGLPWSREHRNFRQNRAAVSAAQAMYVRKLKVTGGTRAVDAMRSKLQSALNRNNVIDTNPPAAAASTFIENSAATLEDMPKGTGAGDAKTDGEALLLMAGLGAGLYPHYLGAGDAYRLATATAMELPVKKKFTRYQKFWEAQFLKMAKIVLWAAKEYGNQLFEEPIQIDVTMDKLLDFDLGTLANLFSSIFNPSYLAGLIPSGAAKGSIAQVWRIVLQILGISNADDLTSDDAFEIVEPEQVTAELAKLRAQMAEAVAEMKIENNGHR